jgi:hypothetical protein
MWKNQKNIKAQNWLLGLIPRKPFQKMTYPRGNIGLRIVRGKSLHFTAFYKIIYVREIALNASGIEQLNLLPPLCFIRKTTIGYT